MTAAFSQLEIDPAIVARAKAGDDRAGEAIFRQFERPVYNLAARMCNCPDDAFDVLQDTFVKALTRLDQYREDAPFWAWLRQITVNLCISRLRKLKRRDFTVIGDLPAPGIDPDAQMDLAAAFETLPSEARMVVWLYDVEGFSHQEIAALFNHSVSFSKTQLSRARKRLRDLLDRPQEDPTCPDMIPAP